MELSDSYVKQRDTYDNKVRYNHLQEKCTKLQRELDASQAQLREERRKNQELS